TDDRLEVGDESRVGHRLAPGDVELVERCHQRLGHEAATEVAEEAPLVCGVLGHDCPPGAVVAAVMPVMARTAPVGSPSFTRASPTSTTRAPSPAKRRTSARPVIPDSATRTRSSGTRGASRPKVSLS